MRNPAITKLDQFACARNWAYDLASTMRIRPGHAVRWGKIVLGLLLVMTIASWLHSVPAQPRAFQCSQLLCHQTEPDDGKVMIERICEPNSRALHDRKAGGVDGGQLVQIRASKIFPRLFQVAQLAWKNPYRAGLVDSFLPCQRDISIGVTIEKCECLDDYGNGTVKFRAHSAQQLPLLSRLRM